VLLPTLASCGSLILSWVTLGRRGAARTTATRDRLAVPYGVAIAGAGLIVVVSPHLA
jgi:hypothetical protein